MLYLRYLWYVLKHKYYVGIACFQAGLYWQGLIHDWHKFLPSEFFPYARYFYGKGHTITSRRDKTGYWKPGETGVAEFDRAWFLHQKRAKHHWQSYVMPADYNPKKRYKGYDIYIMPIPEKYLKEMLCDWKGAGLAQGVKTGVLPWWQANNHKMVLHPESRKWIEEKLG